MKKSVIRAVAVLSAFLLIISVTACKIGGVEEEAFGGEYYNTVADRANVDYTSEKNLYHDFSDGIDEGFSLVTAIWGNDGSLVHQGNVAENVYLTTDGALALRVNGDYYRGSAVGETNGIRTGAAITTDRDYGPGRYEIRMRSAVRGGVCSAFWVYEFDSDDPAQNGWNEIDIEIVGGGSGVYDKIFYTTWQRAGMANTQIQYLESLKLNDGEWHVHTFDWYTDYAGSGKGRVDWFIDGELLHYTEKDVSLKSGNIWIGAMRSGEWVGESLFETDWMLVDWVRYIPFSDMAGWVNSGYDNGFNTHIKNFPLERIEITEEMLCQRLANSGFENVDEALPYPLTADKLPYKTELSDFAAVGWRKGRSGSEKCECAIVRDTNGGNALAVYSGEVYQIIEGVYEGYGYRLDFKAKRFADGGNGKLAVSYYDKDGRKMGGTAISVDSDEYTEYEEYFYIPCGCDHVSVSLSGAIFDNVQCFYVQK